MADYDGKNGDSGRIPSAARGSFSSRSKSEAIASERQKLRWTVVVLFIPLAMMAFLFYRVDRMIVNLRDVREITAGYNSLFADMANRMKTLEARLEVATREVERLSETSQANDAAVSRLGLMLDGVFAKLDSPESAGKTAEQPAPQTARPAPAAAAGDKADALDYGKFLAGYLGDAAKYDARYRDKTVTVSMPVGNVEPTPSLFSGDGKLCVRSAPHPVEKANAWLRCIFPDERSGALSALQPGETVRIRGKVMGVRGNDVVYLRDCVLVQ